jgi:hypothetical protein
MNVEVEASDRAALHRSAELLEATGRRSSHSTVALNSLAAVHLLARIGVGACAEGVLPMTDGQTLREVLNQFGGLSNDTLRQDVVLDALHHVLVAHLAAR